MDVVFLTKKQFFDRSAVIAAVGRAKAAVLSKAGAFVRRDAKGSIRYAKSPAKPGNPPHAHRDAGLSKTSKSGRRQSVSPLRELLYFAFDAQTRSVVVGPVPFAAGTAPRTLELGGKVATRRNPRRTKRIVGKSGEIRIGGTDSVTTKMNRDGAMVTYCKLRTQAQADRANRLNEELYGPEETPSVFIAPRPFMGPALKKNTAVLPSMWANSVT